MIEFARAAWHIARMLSYQHLYHAGNLADVHKHALLAWVLDYMTTKDKPLSYFETHAGRGYYRLDSSESRKTGEAAAGIQRVERAFSPEHPYIRAIDATRASHGAQAYPGSPLIAAHFLRPGDMAHLAELHPAEQAALAQVAGFARLHHQDGRVFVRQRRQLGVLADPAEQATVEIVAAQGRIAAR